MKQDVSAAEGWKGDSGPQRYRLVADLIDPSALDAFHAAAVGLSHAGGGNAGKTGEETVVGCRRFR